MLYHNLYEILDCLRLVETNNAHLPVLVITVESGNAVSSLYYNLYDILDCLRLVETNRAHIPLLVIIV